MDKAQFAQLVENIKTDGALTGAVTCYQPNGEGPIEILSGHHRSSAAIAAGLSEIDTVVIVTELDENRKRAIQLSHNAIVGRDDPATLIELYMSLDLSAKRFSGLTDDQVQHFDKVDLSCISSGSIKYQELSIHFLPADLESFTKDLDKLAKSAKAERIAGRFEDFDRFFDALIKTKRVQNVANSAVALSLMADLAIERLAEIEAAAQAAVAADTTPAPESAAPASS